VLRHICKFQKEVYEYRRLKLNNLGGSAVWRPVFAREVVSVAAFVATVSAARKLIHSLLWGHKAVVLIFDATDRIKGIPATAESGLGAIPFWAIGPSRYGVITINMASLHLSGLLEDCHFFICEIEICCEVIV
jgi:hypothetical protein